MPARNFVSIDHKARRIHFHGEVLSAANYYDYTRKNADGKFADDWYIELRGDPKFGSVYMKQCLDGMEAATVTFFETAEDLADYLSKKEKE